jgi:hypothetical protein
MHMTSELWDDLRGLEKVQAILANRQAREAKKRYNPNARMKGETDERLAQRIRFQDQRAFVRAMRGNPFLIDVDTDG